MGNAGMCCSSEKDENGQKRTFKQGPNRAKAGQPHQQKLVPADLNERSTFATNFDPLNADHYMSGGNFGALESQDGEVDPRLSQNSDQPQN